MGLEKNDMLNKNIGVFISCSPSLKKKGTKELWKGLIDTFHFGKGVKWPYLLSPNPAALISLISFPTPTLLPCSRS